MIAFPLGTFKEINNEWSGPVTVCLGYKPNQDDYEISLIIATPNQLITQSLFFYELCEIAYGDQASIEVNFRDGCWRSSEITVLNVGDITCQTISQESIKHIYEQLHKAVRFILRHHENRKQLETIYPPSKPYLIPEQYYPYPYRYDKPLYDPNTTPYNPFPVYCGNPTDSIRTTTRTTMNRKKSCPPFNYNPIGPDAIIYGTNQHPTLTEDFMNYDNKIGDANA